MIITRGVARLLRLVKLWVNWNIRLLELTSLLARTSFCLCVKRRHTHYFIDPYVAGLQCAKLEFVSVFIANWYAM
jgi:hypothetical protein